MTSVFVEMAMLMEELLLMFFLFFVDLYLKYICKEVLLLWIYTLLSVADQKLNKNQLEKKFPIICAAERQTASPVCQKYANDVLISP